MYAGPLSGCENDILDGDVAGDSLTDSSLGVWFKGLRCVLRNKKLGPGVWGQSMTGSGCRIEYMFGIVNEEMSWCVAPKTYPECTEKRCRTFVWIIVDCSSLFARLIS